MSRKTRSNTKLSVREDAFIIKTGLRVISGFVNWICVMQAFHEEILCMLLMYSNVSVKTRLYDLIVSELTFHESENWIL